MTVDLSQYTPPGVYVQGTPQTLVTLGGVPATTVTIVGAARGYQTYTQSFTMAATAQDLAKKGVLAGGSGVPVPVVVTAGGVELAPVDDYTLVLGATPSDYSTLAVVAASTKVDAGDLVSVSYAYADDLYFTPQAFDDFTMVESVYGAALSPAATGSPVSSPLSLAARIAFANGASTVVCLPTETPAGAVTLQKVFSDAYAKLANDFDITLLVPVFASLDGNGNAHTLAVPDLLSDLKVHCEGQSAEGYGRIGFAGVDTVYVEATAPLDDLAVGVKSSRVFLAYPTRMNLYNNTSGRTIEVGGCYLAAAYAGGLAGGAVNRGITQSQVFGFTGIPTPVKTTMSTSAKNTLSSSGVTVVEPSRNNSLRIRHGISTDPSNLVTAEVSITRTFDILYQLVLDGLQDADLIGDPIDAGMGSRVKGILTGILEGAVQGLVIREWLSLNVRQQTLPSGDPTAIECVFSYRPFLPLNYILVSFTMDLTTGDTTVTDLTAG